MVIQYRWKAVNGSGRCNQCCLYSLHCGKGLTYYRCVATDTLEGAAAKSYSAVAEIFVIGEGEEHIEVSFRPISSTFTVKHGSTVRDLFQ